MWDGFISIIITGESVGVYPLTHHFPFSDDQFKHPSGHSAKSTRKARKPERAQVATVKVDCCCCCRWFGRRLMEKNTQNVLSLIRHMCQQGRQRPGQWGGVRQRWICPQCKQNAYVNYTRLQNRRNKRTLTTKANAKPKLCLPVFVWIENDSLQRQAK